MQIKGLVFQLKVVKDVFVHVTAVREAGLETLDENQEVEFEMVDGRDGRQCAGDLKLSSE